MATGQDLLYRMMGLISQDGSLEFARLGLLLCIYIIPPSN